MKSKKPMMGESTQAEQDPAHGQVVVIFARWILIATGLVLMLWLPSPIEQLRFQIFFILLLAMANFYLHAQLLLKRPAVQAVAYLASAGDIALITLLILLSGGYTSDLYIFYFPALLALSVAFATRPAFAFGGAVICLYAALSLFTSAAARDLTEATTQIILARVLMLGAVVFAGNLYWRIERDRRQAALELQEPLPAPVSTASAE